MLTSQGSVESRLLGATEDVGVQRGLAEFRMGRPVVFVDSDGARMLALPIDGADADRVAAFKSLSPQLPSLAVTPRRAQALGVETESASLLQLTPFDDAGSIFSLAASVKVERRIVASTAGPGPIAAIALAKLAHRLPALLVTDIPASASLGPAFVCVETEAVTHFRQHVINSLAVVSNAHVPLENGLSTRFVVFRDVLGGSATAIVVGKPDFKRPVPVRLHSACLTGDVFGSRRCDCGDQLKLALARLNDMGGGIVLYMDQEGRGVGLVNKIRAYKLQDAGLDTVDANTTLGFEDDERDYRIAAKMLELLDCNQIQLLTNNPGKIESLLDAGIRIDERLPITAPVSDENRRYLTAKAERAGHWLDGVAGLSKEHDKRREPDLVPPA